MIRNQKYNNKTADEKKNEKEKTLQSTYWVLQEL